jgi:hypothetical protein
MAKFQQIEVNGQYQFKAINAAARKIIARYGIETVTPGSMLLIIKETKGNVEFVK